MIDHLHAASCCPNCKQPLNGSTGTSHEDAPGPGDFSLCFYCTAPLVLDAEMKLRLPTVDELREMQADPDFVFAAVAFQMLRIAETSGETRH